MIVLSTDTTVTAVTTVKKTLLSQYSNLKNLTNNVMFSGQGFAILAMF